MILSPNNDLSKISESLSDAKSFLEESTGKNIKFINVSKEPCAKQYHEAMANLTHAIIDAARLRSAPVTNLCREEASSDIAYPIFIGGSHKSGTTLLRNLLDGHESLNVLPGDGHGIRYADRILALDSTQHEFAIINTILHCTAMPIAGENPRWLLGQDPITYKKIGVLVRRSLVNGSANSKQILDVIAQTFHEISMPADGIRFPRKWVEKSTSNIEDAVRLARLYPNAKVLHIVRHPGAIIAAQKRKQPLKNRSYSINREIDTIHQSMRYGVSNKRYFGNDRYYIIRFEDLVSDTETVMHGVAKFLDVPCSEILFTPTVFAKPAGSNTSRMTGPVVSGLVDSITSDRWREELPLGEVKFIEGLFGPLLNFYGYHQTRTSIFSTLFSANRCRIKLNCDNGHEIYPHWKWFLWLIKIKICEFYHSYIKNIIRFNIK